MNYKNDSSRNAHALLQKTLKQDTFRPAIEGDIGCWMELVHLTVGGFPYMEKYREKYNFQRVLGKKIGAQELC